MQQLSLFWQDEPVAPRPAVKAEEKGIKRLYYSIAEVSRITGLKPYVLRFWETEFKELRPAKNRAGNRTYRKSDIRLLFLIKRLLYQEKFTIDGARKRLQELKKGGKSEYAEAEFEARISELITDLQQDLQALLKVLDQK